MRLRRDRVARPPQATPLVINHLRVGIEELSLDILKIRVIEPKLSLQGSVRHTSAALEDGQSLLQNLLKAHGCPFLERMSLITAPPGDG